MSNIEMPIVTDLTSLQTFFKMAIGTVGGFDLFETLSVGPDGVLELSTLFESKVTPDKLVCTYQVAETPLTENRAGLSTATFACTVMIVKKIGGKAMTPEQKMQVRDQLWKKMLRLVGLIREASEWYAKNVHEIEGEAYEIIFDVFQDKILPLGKIANANTQGWLVDIDVTIPVNKLMYS